MSEQPLRLGDLTINPNTQEVSRRGKTIKLRKKEYQLLEFLVRNKNRVLNRLTILEYVWSYNSSATTNTLEVHIAALRKKIDGGHAQKLLHTIHGLGYKLSDAPNPEKTTNPSNTPPLHPTEDLDPPHNPRR